MVEIKFETEKIKFESEKINLTFPVVFNILRGKCDEGAQYKRSPLSIERRITGCKFFQSAFWNIPTGAVFLKSKESRKNRETALSIKRA